MPPSLRISFSHRFGRILLILTVGAALPVKTAGEARGKIALDLAYAQSGIILRMRPLDYVWPSRIRRMDLLLGHRFRRISAYVWIKGDSRQRGWLGTRLDYEFLTPDSTFSAKLQFRLFHALNKRSHHQVYFIPIVYYRPKATGWMRLGVLGYGKKNFGKDHFFYLGPAVLIQPARLLRLSLSYGWDVFGAGGFLYVKTTINLN